MQDFGTFSQDSHISPSLTFEFRFSVKEGMDCLFYTYTWSWIVIDKASGEVKPTYQFTQGNI